MFTDGYVTGLNYWASNAGIRMWSDFDEQVIDQDFAKIAALKMDVVRLFPLWSEFQPLHQLYGYGGKTVELRFKGDVLPPDTEAGRAGVDEEMLRRFGRVLQLAEKHGLKVAVGIVTGWMSGRLYAPPALEGKSPITDPLAVKLAMDFIRILVSRFRDEKVIVGWTSGNETDCLAGASMDQLLAWSAAMRNTIRAYDPHQRPIMEDMHFLRGNGCNMIHKRRDLFDVTTVHPYSYFTNYANNEPLTSMRGLLHAVAEAKAYEGVSHVPCLIEEIGTLGNFLCSPEVSAAYARTNLYSSWANGMTGMLWWCANEQVNLKYPPYSWGPLERELGVFDEYGDEKPVAKEFRAFKETVSSLPFTLTPPQTDAVCILPGDNLDWARVLGSYVLSKQGGFTLAYAHQRSIPESRFYILPSLNNMIEGSLFDALLERVAAGATLAISFAAGILFSHFLQITGNKLIHHTSVGTPAKVGEYTFARPEKLTMEAVTSTVLMQEADGNPILTVADYGKGRILFCAVPVEKQFSESAGEADAGLCAVYKQYAQLMELPITRSDRHLGITNHTLADGTRVAVVINYSDKTITDTVALQSGTIGRVYLGEAHDNTVVVEPFSATLFEVK